MRGDESKGRLTSSLRFAPAVLAGGILLLGAFLRFYQLGAESLWLDEGVSVRIAGFDPARIIQRAESDPTPPLYYLLLHYWISIFGDSDFSVRALSAIPGSLAVYVMYRVGDLMFNRATGLMAALILALSSYHVFYSQEARVYSILCLLALTSFYFFVRLLREGANRRFAVACYLASTILLMYAHVYGLFLVIVQNVYVFAAHLTSRGRTAPGFKTWISFQAGLALLYVPGILFLLEQILRPQGRAWVEEPTLVWLAELLPIYSGSLPLAFLFAAFAAVAIAEGLVASARRTGSGGVWLLVPVALPFAITNLSSSPVLGHPRHAILVSLALYLLAAKGVDTLTSRVLRGPLALAGVALAAVLVAALSAPGLYEHFDRVDKDQWRQATYYVEEHAEPGDLVLYDLGLLFNHYSDREDLDKKGIPREEPEAILAGRDRVWLMTRDEESPPVALDERLDRSFRAAEQKQYRSIDLTLYERAGQ